MCNLAFLKSSIPSMTITLETDRLLLRPYIAEDAQAFFELDSDPEVMKYIGLPPVTDIEKTKEIIRKVQQQYVDYGLGRFAVIEKASDTVIGWSGLKYETLPFNNKNGYYDVGYRFQKKYWGKGYATESATVSLKYGFEDLQLEKICGAAHVGNLASCKVLTKIGLEFIESFHFEDMKCNWYETDRSSYFNKE